MEFVESDWTMTRKLEDFLNYLNGLNEDRPFHKDPFGFLCYRTNKDPKLCKPWFYAKQGDKARWMADFYIQDTPLTWNGTTLVKDVKLMVKQYLESLS